MRDRFGGSKDRNLMIWKNCIRPLLFKMPAESAHHFSMSAFATLTKLKIFNPVFRGLCNVNDDRLNVSVCGLQFPNPVGLAAGFDKNAQWFQALGNLGFGHVEVGSITGQGQPGNPQPRMFRLPKDSGLINRMGFNNLGSEVASANLKRLGTDSFRKSHVLGINLGKTKVVPLEEAPEDYLKSFRLLFPFADYIAINVSSPNTPGLRELQDREPLLRLLDSIGQLNSQMSSELGVPEKPVFLKIAPDLNDEQIKDIASIVVSSPASGIIATNTTISRDNLHTSDSEIEAIGNGGLSGRPLTEASRKVVQILYNETKGSVPIIGVGGVFTGEDAWQMIRAGASLVQLYTGFIYGGPLSIRRINNYLLKKTHEHNLDSIQQAVGKSTLV